jgi:hypothetical protein
MITNFIRCNIKDKEAIELVVARSVATEQSSYYCFKNSLKFE